jgi:hypothetical protein
MAQAMVETSLRMLALTMALFSTAEKWRAYSVSKPAYPRRLYEAT